MLGFIKKYQKIFFIVIAALVTFSVTFVGILPKNLSATKDPTVFKTVVGEKVKRSQYEGIKSILSTNNGEMLLYGGNLGLHFFVEDAFSENIVNPKLIEIIAEKSSESLQDHWKQQLTREKNYKPYSHPQSSILSAESVWQRHAPNIPTLLESLKKEKDALKAFKIRAELFKEENQFSSYALWQFLNEQQKQYSWLAQDENMAPQSLSLFGYHTLQDWFGEKMIDYVTQFIIQVSSIGKKRGYQATFKEAENSLMTLNEQAYKQLKFLGLKDFNDAESYLQAKLVRLGMNKMDLISYWQSVLTFQNMLNEAAHLTLLDDLTLEEFEKYASQEVEVCRYMPPQELCFKTPSELAQFEAYLQALGKKPGELALHFDKAPIEEIEAQYPQLVEQKIAIKYKEVNLDEEAVNISVQKLWSFKADPQNALLFKSKFPNLKIDDAMTKEEYASAMEELDFFTQMQVDQFAREHILKEDKEWLKLAFEKSEEKTEEFLARKSGSNWPFKGLEIADCKKKFISSIFDHKNNFDFNQEYCFDKKHYYLIEDIEVIGVPIMVSYDQVYQDKIGEKLLNKVLSENHKQGHLQDQDFSKVKPKLIAGYLKPLYQAIANDYEKHTNKKPANLTDHFYCQHRLYQPMRELLGRLNKNDLDNLTLASLNLAQKKEVLVRSESDSLELNQLLTQTPNSYTPVIVQGQPQFVKLIASKHDENTHPMQKNLRLKLSQQNIERLGRQLIDQIEFISLK